MNISRASTILGTIIMATTLSLVSLAVAQIIPAPTSLTEDKSSAGFALTPQTQIACAESAWQAAAQQLAQDMARGMKVKALACSITKTPTDKNAIFITKSTMPELQGKGDEAYAILITPNGIRVEVNGVKGIFYAGRTLAMLLPIEFYHPTDTAEWKLPTVKVVDYPRFKWRAMMLDCCRHFWTVDQIKQILIQMADVKMNVFHWHLTDDQGWRIEIKKYPKLTSIGSKREGTQVGGYNSKEIKPGVVEGYYTQEEIKDIVAFAAKLNITVVPEIEMPGHSTAIAVAYPEFTTTKEKVPVTPMFGKLPSALDPSNEKTFKFLSDILDEVRSLFPVPIIHIGGDEVLYTQWNESPAIKKLVADKKLKNTNTDVHVYFCNRMAQIIKKKGARMMGWNEIMGVDVHGASVHGKAQESASEKLDSAAIIHFWKGDPELAKKAIEAGHDVVNSTHSDTYLDYSYSTIPLERAYNFDPLFKGLDPKMQNKVLGTGCQMWVEWIDTTDKWHRQIFPRAIAYAEVGWSQLERKDFDDFKKRLIIHGKRMQSVGVNPSEEAMPKE